MLVNGWRESGEYMVSLARMRVKGNEHCATVEVNAREREAA